MNNKVAMERANMVFTDVEEGIAEVARLAASDYSGGKAKKSGLVREMNSKAHASITEAIVDMEKEIDRSGKVLDEMRAGRADALIALEAINLSIRYLEEHGSDPPMSAVSPYPDDELEKTE